MAIHGIPYSMVPDGTIWYQIVLYGTRWYYGGSFLKKFHYALNFSLKNLSRNFAEKLKFAESLIISLIKLKKIHLLEKYIVRIKHYWNNIGH